MATSIARRTGTIHVFDDPSELAAYAGARKSGSVPVVVRDAGDEAEVGRGRMCGAYLKGNELVGTVELPDDVETYLSRPGFDAVARPEFDESGAVVRLVVESVESEDYVPGVDDQIERHKVPPMAKQIVLDTGDDEKSDSVFERLVHKPQFEGDPVKLALALIRQNQKLGTQVKDLEAKQLPADHVAIPKADADALAAYRELDPDPGAVRQRIEDGDTAVRSLAMRLREDKLKEVAENAGYKGSGFKVFLKLVGPESGIEFEPAKVRDKRTNKEIDTFRARFKGEDGKEVVKTLPEMESEYWADYVPALRVEAVDRPETGRTSITGWRGAGQPIVTNPNAVRTNVRVREETPEIEPNRQFLVSTGMSGM